MAAGELDMEKTDFSMTNATTFDHHSAKITAFFIQASCCRCFRCFSLTAPLLPFPPRFSPWLHSLQMLETRASRRVRNTTSW